MPLSFGDEQFRWEVIERLDREYQWTQNDRRIGELIYIEPETLADYLQFYLHGKVPMAALKGQTGRNWGWPIWRAIRLIITLARMANHRPY